MTAQPPKYGFALVAAAIAVLPLLPFLNKAAHIDDPLFLWSAQHIIEHPRDFYGFDVNWYGRTQPMREVTQNPPLVSYYLALVMRFFGSREWVLHAAMLLPAALAGAGTYLLASRFCTRPLLAALFVAVSPAFVVSGTTLMCDITMLAFWVWAVFLWMYGLERRAWACLILAALLAGLSGLSKYFGASLVPLLAIHALCQGKGYRRYLGALLLPAAMLVAYELLTAHLYGRGLFLDAVLYASEIEHEYGRSYLGKTLVGLIFLGGCLVFPLVLPFYCRSNGRGMSILLMIRNQGRDARATTDIPLVAGSPDPTTPTTGSSPVLRLVDGPWRGVILAGVLGIAVLILMFTRFDGMELIDTAGLDTLAKATQGWLWALAGLMAIAPAAGDFSRGNWRESLFLSLWLGGVLFFACFVNHFVNARVILPAAVPAAILLIRRMDSIAHSHNAVASMTATLSLAIALMAGASDYRQAENGRRAARDAASAPHEGRLWFVGHWGFQYYMEQAGALPLELERPRFRAGETVLIPDNNTSLIRLDPAMIAESSVALYPAFPLLSTMRRENGAGFHSDVWGPLPFVFGPSAPESYARIVLAPPPSANP